MKTLLLLFACAVAVSLLCLLLFSDRSPGSPCAVADLAQEHEYLWLATSDGLVRFHTPTFRYDVVAPPDPFSAGLTTVAVDACGNKWVGTEHHGVMVFDDTTWTLYSTDNSSLTSDRITEIGTGSDSSVWIATAKELIRHRNGTWTVFSFSAYPALHEISTVLAVHPAEIWIGTNCSFHCTSSAGVYRLADGVLTELARGIAVRDIALQDHRMLLVGRECDHPRQSIYDCRPKGRLLLDGNPFNNLHIPDLPAGSSELTAAAFDGNDALWVAFGGTDGSGIAHRSRDSAGWTIHRPPGSASAPLSVRRITVDTRGILWIASSSGLLRYDGRTWTMWRSFAHPADTAAPPEDGAVGIVGSVP